MAMAKTQCSMCGKEARTFNCRGCSKDFCRKDLTKHLQSLSEQLDHIENNHDELRQKLLDQKDDPKIYSLMQEIDQWKKESIKKIKQTAEECREQLMTHTHEFFLQIENQLNNLAKQMKEIREENQFNEIDLQQLKEKLTKLEEELTRSVNLSIKQEPISFINKISILILVDKSKTTRSEGQVHGTQSNTELLKLVQLLDQDQPYEKMARLPNLVLRIPDNDKIRRIQGSLVGLAIGNALGASVEFRPNAYFREQPVTNMQGGGTWGLEAGQWTPDTSMALCLAASLIVKGEFNAYDQFVRYKRWYREGYMSSTGKCFDIGTSTREAITKFEGLLEQTRLKLIAEKINPKDINFNAMLEDRICNDETGLKYGAQDAAGNGPLARLAPVPCFFFRSYDNVEKNIDKATQLTHGDPKAIDACRFYAALIWHALDGMSKEELLDKNFYRLLSRPLHKDIQAIAEGSYKKKKKGYEDGIRGKGYVVNALEAALWAFYNDNDEFEKGALSAVNLGDDTDTTAAIYGQLAGAVYGIDNIPTHWMDRLYHREFIMTVAKGLYVQGERFTKN